MEQININPVGEQLESPTTLGTAVHSEIEGGSATTGSPFGKFNNANDLLNAYNNLQSEFTRKCQKLSELEKQQASSDNESTSTSVEEETPQYVKADWQEQISEFLKSHPDAQNFAKEIANEIYSDKVLALSPHSLELAYGRILAKNYKSKEQLANDDEFLEKYIYSNSQITKRILDDYLKDFTKSPHLISSKVGAVTGLSPNKKPNNLTEARKYAELLFK